MEHQPRQASKAVEDVEVAGSDSETEPESEPEAAKPWPIVTLDKTWEDHYRRMLILIYPLAAELGAEGMLATESTWRRYVYAPSELLLLNNPHLTVESNSEVRARPWKLAPPWLEDARLDATLGVKVIKERADVVACATGWISFSFADIEEKRSSEDNKDESKLLVIMGIRLWHLAKSIGTVGIFDIMGNGIPLPVSVGVLRSAVRWSVYFMWRQFDSRTQQVVYKWSRLLDCPSLATPEGFLHYTTFMWRLSVYGDLFACAVRKQLRRIAPYRHDLLGSLVCNLNLLVRVSGDASEPKPYALYMTSSQPFLRDEFEAYQLRVAMNPEEALTAPSELQQKLRVKRIMHERLLK
ncbi:uncharacterized protein ACA1_244120 [Acanthamoeba castellanii str. Neff]|uniref:Uncharacterized protein n=1 Tax=Acanthamoeba castellanii (strain ATCC 30010 / Neff) TaxID=1257118 RepID=L8GK47_ACACF|nr:uncharacterized protein ACA1_244120 [Acanthamoeba castellanii str. Neff]ELR13412.1 hypothetical protein ACA1_244120 [Acanthamoeba castellanii str. Neff]